ncbi:MAG: hypothetical protein M1827_005606 [Pycnora praestabilis]|nr:MAG: hypothetical protein M1827_005606 [Pycnora praestabilis]
MDATMNMVGDLATISLDDTADSAPDYLTSSEWRTCINMIASRQKSTANQARCGPESRVILYRTLIQCLEDFCSTRLVPLNSAAELALWLNYYQLEIKRAMLEIQERGTDLIRLRSAAAEEGGLAAGLAGEALIRAWGRYVGKA